MAGGPRGAQAKPDRNLIADGNPEYQLVGGESVPRTHATLVQNIFGIDVGVVVGDHPLDSARSAGLLVGSRDHHDVARGHDACLVQRDQRHELLHAEAFHVECSAAPDVTIADDAAERVDFPGLLVHRDDVHVVQQQQRLFRCITTFEPHDQIGLAVGSTFIELGREAVAFELGPDQRRGFGGIGGRIDGSNAEVLLEKFESVFFELRPVGLGSRGERG